MAKDNLKAERDGLLGYLGATIIRLQYFEKILTFAMYTVVGPKIGKFQISDIFASDSKSRHPSLGLLFRKLQKSTVLDSGFEWRFEKFVEKRNYVVHRLFLGPDGDSTPTGESIHTKGREIYKLNQELDYFTGAIHGFLNLVIESVEPESPDAEELFRFSDASAREGYRIYEAMIRRRSLMTACSQRAPRVTHAER